MTSSTNLTTSSSSSSGYNMRKKKKRKIKPVQNIEEARNSRHSTAGNNSSRPKTPSSTRDRYEYKYQDHNPKSTPNARVKRDKKPTEDRNYFNAQNEKNSPSTPIIHPQSTKKNDNNSSNNNKNSNN